MQIVFNSTSACGTLVTFDAHHLANNGEPQVSFQSMV